jgi:hypothetical protein
MGESRNAYSYSVDSGATYCMIKRDFLAGVWKWAGLIIFWPLRRRRLVTVVEFFIKLYTFRIVISWHLLPVSQCLHIKMQRGHKEVLLRKRVNHTHSWEGWVWTRNSCIHITVIPGLDNLHIPQVVCSFSM